MPVATVYRYFTEEGVLLYVGVAFDPHARLQQHRVSKDWFYDIKFIRLDHYETRWEALRAEHLAIEIEKPRHNGEPPRKRYAPQRKK
jgi:predicted GIY-YIG superfamily endonuclease